MKILAIDPGNNESGWILLDGETPVDFGKCFNLALLSRIRTIEADLLVVEYMAAMGMPTAQEVLDAQFWTGRFVEAWGGEWHPIKRREVKLAICGSARAKDGNIRQALIDRYGGKEVAIGRKKTPGPLFGISNDVWQALAVGITYLDSQEAHQATGASRDDLGL
jgi:hypothetical protein